LKKEFTLTNEFSDGRFTDIFRLDMKFFDYMDKLIGSDILAEICNPPETQEEKCPQNETILVRLFNHCCQGKATMSYFVLLNYVRRKQYKTYLGLRVKCPIFLSDVNVA